MRSKFAKIGLVCAGLLLPYMGAMELTQLSARAEVVNNGGENIPVATGSNGTAKPGRGTPSEAEKEEEKEEMPSKPAKLPEKTPFRAPAAPKAAETGGFTVGGGGELYLRCGEQHAYNRFGNLYHQRNQHGPDCD